ncbi:MAG: hypothetical protein CL910_16425 [Deltaproteobacteria bacterium]|nr:hypothetical protein [Deltaproteobacteria bacterium]
MAGLLDRLRFGRRLAAATRGQLEIAVLRSGLDAGLFEALKEPKGPAELADALELELDLSAAWLRAAHAHGLLDLREGKYRPSAYVDWLHEGADAAGARAMVGQVTLSYTPTLARLPSLLKGEERPVFGQDREEAIRVAEGSRVTEKVAFRALHRIPGVSAARRILDIGCGAGSYLAELLGRTRDALGTGVEVDPAVAERARQRLRVTEVSRRAQIVEGDFLEVDLPRDAFDLVLLNNNLHYFDAEDRPRLLARAYESLAASGVLAIQTPSISDSATARAMGARATMATFDLFLRSHANLHGLPLLDELDAELRAVGFQKLGRRPIVPGGMALYVWARKGREP